MRVGILRRHWLAGGAETYLPQIGASLEDMGHDVRYLATEDAPPEDALRVLGWARAATSFDLVADDARSVAEASAAYDLFINAASHWLIEGRAGRNWLIIFAPAPPSNRSWRRCRRSMTAVARRSLYLAPKIPPVPRLQRRLRLHPDVAEGRALASYERLIGVSTFVASLVERQFRRPCSVLYPCVELQPPGEAKQFVISTVGRFSPWGNAKRHDILLHAAALLAPQEPRLRFVFIGSVPEDECSAEYLRGLRTRSDAVPVTFLVDADPAQVHEVLARSMLYWHAAGFEIDPRANPGSVEQFGMSIVEAMAHGAVPCVVPGAGPAEIVTDGVDGVYWHTPDELVARTVDLLDHPRRLETLSVAARARAGYFDRDPMRRSIEDLLQVSLG